MQNAMRAKSIPELDTLRMLIAALTNEQKAAGKDLVDGVPDETVIAIIRREVKKRKEAYDIYKSAGREELALKEDVEQTILKSYLPPEMSTDEILKIVLKKKEDLGITDKKDAGILMGRVMKELGGKVDGGTVKGVIESVFS